MQTAFWLAAFLGHGALWVELVNRLHGLGWNRKLIDRLTLNQARLQGVIQDLRQVIDLPDPAGEVFDAYTLPNGLKVRKQRVPVGVLAVIYEARPNVTIDVAGLALKTGNAIILRGGTEHVVDELDRAMEDALRVVGVVIEDKMLVPGGRISDVKCCLPRGKLSELGVTLWRL